MMQFLETGLSGAFVIEPERIQDERGFFARLLCERELRDHGLLARICQTNIGVSTLRGTLRGLHYQTPPHAEVKIVRCSRGAIFDVIADLRPESTTFTRWFGVELTEHNYRAIYVPEGFAQGYLTLRGDTEIYYHTSEAYHPESATGVRYDDLAFGIEWPAPIETVSTQDRQWPDFAHALIER